MTTQQGIIYHADTRQLECQGIWDVHHLPELSAALSALHFPTSGQLTIIGHAISKMDSAGAWLVGKWQQQLQQQGLTVVLESFPKQQQELLSIVEQTVKNEKPLPVTEPVPLLERIGKETVIMLKESSRYLAFVGKLTIESLRLIRQPKRMRWNALGATIIQTGYQALPIIALLSFMIGVVLTYQMGLQLRTYGASIYIVDLLGLAVLREFGPLITSIMVAGRTGSAFTAQLGMMKLNQEVDALDTMGVTPGELLILPRILGLIIALPLLTMWSDIFGVFGGMVMANNLLGITWYDFLHRFPSVIPLRALLIGLLKTPVFAFIIATVGCYQGMQVQGSADSVGRNTTRSVVTAIFFIIVADAIFSVIFSKLKL